MSPNHLKWIHLSIDVIQRRFSDSEKSASFSLCPHLPSVHEGFCFSKTGFLFWPFYQDAIYAVIMS